MTPSVITGVNYFPFRFDFLRRDPVYRLFSTSTLSSGVEVV